MSDISVLPESVNIHLEGQVIPLPAHIAESDELIRKALVPYYEGVATATIRRETKDGAPLITVVKRADPKGQI